MKLIIDVHEHIFRGRDIPVKGYLYSRRYKGIALIARALRLPTLLARCIRMTQRRGEFGPFCRFLIRIVSIFEREDYRTWAEILSLADIEKVAHRLRDTFKKDRIDLFVPLMIDYEYWFKNTVDNLLVHQIDDVYRYVVLRSGGKIHPFVPFDPVRELAYRKKMASPDGSTERDGSLALVKDAIANKGFIGVKIYNSLGYRPWGNAEVDTERRNLFKKNGMERYAAITGREIDKVLDELYTYCEMEQVPITAHCVADGIESYWKASYVFGNPSHWHTVLRRHPTLHLNLAHFGWCDAERYSLGGTDGNAPWVKQICDMVRDYPFVYTDVAHHEVAKPEKLKGFLNDYALILKAYPDVIQKKLLYGIDWHVITRVVGYENFLRDYLSLLKGNGLFRLSEIADFLGGNALHFLGLLKTGTPAASGWTKSRKRLGFFYKRNQIPPPRWFAATGP